MNVEDFGTWNRRKDRPLVMGTLNATPDSFYDGGRYPDVQSALAQVLRMLEEGADIIDIGGESSRPGSAGITVEEEIERVIPIIKEVNKRSDVVISVDTTKALVAREAVEYGATVINDISALRFDEEMAAIAAETGSYVVLMHMQGEPSTMQDNPRYENVVEEVAGFFGKQMSIAVCAGISESKIILDPGIGFGKSLEHNIALLCGLSRFRQFDRPVMIGVSRKSMIGDILNVPAIERLEGTIAVNAIAVANGADIIRVHDVKEGRHAADVGWQFRADDN